MINKHVSVGTSANAFDVVL